MLLLENIDLDSFLGKISVVHVKITQLNQDVIFFMSARDITSIGIQEEILLVILWLF